MQLSNKIHLSLFNYYLIFPILFIHSQFSTASIILIIIYAWSKCLLLRLLHTCGRLIKLIKERISHLFLAVCPRLERQAFEVWTFYGLRGIEHLPWLIIIEIAALMRGCLLRLLVASLLWGKVRVVTFFPILRAMTTAKIVIFVFLYLHGDSIILVLGKEVIISMEAFGAQ